MARYSIAVLSDRRKRLLMLRRASTAKLGAGLWAFPGGQIESDESPYDCVHRELREETGLQSLQWLKYAGPVLSRYYGCQFEVHLFHFQWLWGNIALNHEHTEYAWVDSVAYKNYAIMDGIDEDIAYLDVWPAASLQNPQLSCPIPSTDLR